MSVPFVVDDGGRAEAGFRGRAGDCVCRAVSIAAQRPYAEVYAYLASQTGRQRRRKGKSKRVASARNGIDVKRKWFKDFMTSLGFVWVSTMGVGSGCKVHLDAEELPTDRLVVRVSRHMTALIDGVLHDTYDCSRKGTRCVYGYYNLTSARSD